MDNYKKILDIPMGENDANASTIGEYLIKLLLTLWKEGEGFDGKRPFGNSGWEYELYQPLIKAGVVKGELDEDGYIASLDKSEAYSLIRRTIENMY